MPLDPIIAQGVNPGDGLVRAITLGEEIKNRREYNKLHALDQQFRQQKYADEQQQAQLAAQQEADEDERFERARLAGDWQTMGSIDPQATKVLWDIEQSKNPQAGGIKIGQYNPGDYTPETWAQFVKGQDPAVLRRQYAPAAPPAVVVRDVGGVPSVVVPDRSGQAQVTPLSTVAQEAGAAGAIEGAKVTGREDATKASEAPQRIARARSNIEGYENTVAAIDRADKLASGWTTGIMSKADILPGTPQYDLKAELVTIMANIGFDRLQRMRDESPTGGALGQVAIQELAALQNSIANLDRAQSPEQFRKNLQVVRGRYAQFKRAQERAIAQEEARVKGGAAATKEDPLGIR